MQLDICEKFLQDVDNRLYDNMRDFSSSHKNLGRLCALPVALIDTTLGTIVWPLCVIQSVAEAALNFVGAIFSYKDCSLSDGCVSLMNAVVFLGLSPIAFACIPIFIVIQFVYLAIDPQTAESMLCYRGSPKSAPCT